MTPHPHIGARLRRAIERKRMSQEDVAAAIGVSRSTVNAWVNDRAWPMNSIGALEDLLGVDLSAPARPEVYYADPVERAIWADESMPEERRLEFIDRLRAERVAARTIKRANSA